MNNPKTFQLKCQGYELVADFYEGENQDRIYLSLIGYSAARTRYPQMLEELVKQSGHSALSFDYSGHGESPFKLSDIRPAQHFVEVIEAFDWIKKNYPKSKITVIGRSYGGYLATQLTKYREFDELLLIIPAIYPPKDFYTKWQDMDRDWIFQDYCHDKNALESHPLLARASKFQGRTMVVVHGNDELVGVETTDAYIKTFGAETMFFEGLIHSLMDIPNYDIKAYDQKIINWLLNK